MTSPLTLERLKMGEVSGSASPEDLQTLEAMAFEDRQFLREHPTLPKGHSRPFLRPALWLPASAAALLMVFGWSVLSPAGEPEIRAKSSSLSLLVYHRTVKGSELLATGAELSSGEEIQLAYLVAQPLRYLAIVSLDGRGNVTMHFPLGSSEAAPAQASGPQLLPYSYRLDDAPDFEDVYLVASPVPFEIGRVLPFLKGSAAEVSSEMRLPSDLTALRFRIHKKESSR